MMGVKSITNQNTVHRYESIERVEALYNHYRAIQFGEEDDHFGWGTVCPPLADVAAA